MSFQVYTCEEHGSGVIVVYTYRDEQASGTQCPFCFQQEQTAEIENSLRKLIDGIDRWNEAVRKIANVPEHVWPELEVARKLLK